MHGDIVEWVASEPTFCPSMYPTFQALSSGFARRCLSAPGSDDDASTTTKQATAPTLGANLTLLLGEWARATLANGEWKDALVVAGGVSIFFSSTCLVCLTLS